MDRVDKLLEHWRSTPFKWGACDCLLSIADYVRNETGHDWGADFRDKYDTEEGANFFVKQYVSIVHLIDRSTLKRTQDPKRGDILAFSTHFAPDVAVAGVSTGEGVAGRTLNGVAEINMKFVIIRKAWKVPQCRL